MCQSLVQDVCKGVHPSGALGSHHEVREFLYLACDGTGDGVGDVCFGKSRDVVGVLMGLQWVAMVHWSWGVLQVFGPFFGVFGTLGDGAGVFGTLRDVVVVGL